MPTRITKFLATVMLLALPVQVLGSSFGPGLLVNTESFTIIDDAGGGANVELRFGDIVNKSLFWNNAQTRFEFNSNLHVVNNLSGSGTLRIEGNTATKADLFINADNGASDAVLTFGNDALPESLTFKRTLSQFEFSDDVYIANNLSASGSVFLEGNVTADAGTLTVDAAGNEVGIGNTNPHSTLTLSGSFATQTRTVSGAYTVTAADQLILANGTGSSFTITLPSAVGIQGRQYSIKKIDRNIQSTITVSPQAGELIDNLSNYRLTDRGETVSIQSDGTGWRITRLSPYDLTTFRTKGSIRNQWYTSPSNGTALATGAPTINTLRAMPLIITKTTTIDQMAINITTLGAGSNVRVGIYSDNGNNYPDALIADAGSISTAAAGIKTYTTNLPVTLQPGLYWMAIVGNGTAPTMRTFAVGGMNPVLGYASTLPANAQFGWSVAFAFAALPATFTAGGTPITAVPLPAIFVRVSQ